MLTRTADAIEWSQSVFTQASAMLLYSMKRRTGWRLLRARLLSRLGFWRFEDFDMDLGWRHRLHVLYRWSETTVTEVVGYYPADPEGATTIKWDASGVLTIE